MNVAKVLNDEMAIVFAALRRDGLDGLESQDVRNIVDLKGRGRLQFLLNALAGCGLCDRQGNLTRLGQSTPASGQQTKPKEPDNGDTDSAVDFQDGA